MSEIEERQQAPILVLISSCSLKYAYPQSAGGLVACCSVSELMPQVIAADGTRLVPSPSMGRPPSPRTAICGGGQPSMHVWLK